MTVPWGRSLLDEIVRDGAGQMLAAAALHTEVAAYVEQFADHLDDGRRLVVRNGSHLPMPDSAS